jgi:hypothetical protein
MKEKVVEKKKKSTSKKNKSTRNKKVLRVKKVPMPKPEIVYVRGPGKAERTLMFVAKILKVLLSFVEKKIQNLKDKRLAQRMSNHGPDKI